MPLTNRFAGAPIPLLALPLAFVTALLLVSAGCSASSPGERMCSGAGSCGADLCVVGRCKAASSVPSPPDTLRVFLDPHDIAVLSRGESNGGGKDLPGAIAIGRKEGGFVIVLLRFIASWRDDAEVTRAYVVLDPVGGALPARGHTRVETARILDPWDPATASWGRQPRLSLPKTAAQLRPRPSAPLRIDVTSLVREWPKRLPDDHGIALLIEGNDAVGATYSMGIEGGIGPRIEVYVR